MSEERKFDEAAFDKAVAKPNGWSGVADPVAEIRRMRDGDEAFGKDVLRTALSLVRAHFDGAEDVFLATSRELAARLDKEGRGNLASFVRAQTGDEPSWVPMERKRQSEIDAILAEARNKYTVHDCNECDYRKSCDLRFDCDECKTKRQSISLAFGIEDDYFTKLLDQIEKAVDRERTIADIMLAVKDKPLPHPDPDNAPPLFAAPGSAAALREAVENVERVARFCSKMPRSTPGYPTDAARADVLYSRIVELGRVARAALAAPARNCDRFQTGNRLTDAVSALNAYANEEEHEPVRRWNESDWRRFLDWLFVPAKGKEPDNG